MSELKKYWCPGVYDHPPIDGHTSEPRVHLASDVDAQLQPVRWTKEKPTEPGWYWWRGPVWGGTRTKMFEVSKDKAGLYVAAWGYVEFMAGEWSGPIPVPLETTKEVT